MTRPAKSSLSVRARLLGGASAVAMLATGAPSLAAPANPFARTVDPAAAVAAAAQTQASQAAAVGTVSAQAQAAFAQAAALRSQMDAAQAAARAAAAAASSSVPNGLTIGGLQVATGANAEWQGADAPAQSAGANGRIAVSVTQTQSQAILNWQTFNVGQQTDLTFNQGATTWTVLNRVLDPAANPTKILGTISAPGTVLIMNPNGVIFGGASQVNVGAIVAGAANISDSQFLNNGIYSAQSNGTYTPAFTAAGGSVVVQQGAQIITAAPSSVDAGGGYVMLLGQSVTNAGDITTPMGQTLLAAGDNFLVRPGYSTSSNQNSTTNGSEVAVQLNVNSTSGSVTNVGEVISDQGDITLVGRTLTQAGILLSTTDVTQRGSIHLLNAVSDAIGSITLTPGSVTQILPNLSSGATALEAQRAGLIGQGGQSNSLASGQFDNLSTVSDQPENSRVEIVTGGNVEFQGGSLVQAPGGQVAVSAVGRIQVDSGAVIDVSGSDIALPVASNFFSVNIQGEEESDDPLNRTASNLFNDNVWIDSRDLISVAAGTGGYSTARYYTPGGVLNVTGEYANVGSTIGQWTASGGTITLGTGASGAVVAQTGSVFDIAGGSIAYTPGMTPQSYVIASNGGVYNINNAPSNLTYTGFYQGFVENHPRWGVSTTYNNPLAFPTELAQAGYVVGRDAGSLVLSTPTAVFEGQVDAEVVDGIDQTTARASSITDAFLQSQTAVPLAGLLSIDSSAVAVTANQFQSGVNYTPTVTIGQDQPLADSLTVTTAVATGRTGTVDLDAGQLSSFGLGGLSISAGIPIDGVAGSITLNGSLTLADGGTVSFTAPTIALNANLVAHGGAVTATANGGAGTTVGVGQPAIVGNLTVGQNVTVDTTGVWTNAELNPTNQSGLAFLNGGNVTLTSTGNLVLGPGSLIDASSGGAVLSSGATTGGAGGAITLAANYRSSSSTTSPFGALGLVLDGTLRSEGMTQGGVLTLSTYGLVTIGDDALLPGGTLAAGSPAPTELTLSQSVTIAAGAVAPVSFSATYSNFAAGGALPVSVPIPGNTGDGASSNVVLAADWTIPANATGPFITYNQGTGSAGYGTNYQPGQVIPAGSLLWGGYGTLPAGYVLPANVFPNGLTTALTVLVQSGSTSPAPITIPAGTLIPKGTVFNQSIDAQVIALAPSFFSQGFSAYNITGQNVVVTPGASINVVEPVLKVTSASFAAPTGSNPEAILTLWTPPTYLPNPATAKLTQRAGASLSLSAQLGQADALVALTYGIAGTQIAPLTLGQGAVINVDPGQSVALNAWGELDVEGAIHAPGGSISILNSRPFELETTPVGAAADPALSIWIGSTANLDAAARAATFEDLYGRTYGLVQDGGSIVIGGASSGLRASTDDILPSTEAFVVIRPGAVLNASGTSANLDFDAGENPGFSRLPPTDPQFVASNGGSIALSSYSGLYIDGDLQAAAGGPGAAGGTLSLTLESPIYNPQSLAGGANYFSLSNSARQLRIITIDQVAQPSELAATLAAGQADPALTIGAAGIGVSQIASGGFANLSLYAGDAIAFSGNVNLSLAQSLSLNQGAIGLDPSTPNAQVTLSAPYVLMNGGVGHVPDATVRDFIYTSRSLPTATGTGTLSVQADQLDIENAVGFGGNYTLTETSGSSPTSVTENLPGFASINLVSQGDLTFLGGAVTGNNPYGETSLITTGNLNLTAARIYPATDVTAYVIAGVSGPSLYQLSPTGTLTIANVGSIPDAAAPDSVFGTLLLYATTINQGGVVDAPLGSLEIGANDFRTLTAINGGTFNPGVGTQTLNLLPGSITSVSAAGLTIPYGGTSDGINYLYNGAAVTYVDPFNEDELKLPGQAYLPGAVTQGVQLGAQSINVQSGALLNLSGGGNLTGAGFITGEGGSVDVLRTPLVNANPTNVGSASDKVYAIVPGYSGSYAPIAPDAGAGNPGVGQQVTIGAGVPGLAAGTYTLLPSTYALLPGAFRIEIGGTSKTSVGVAALTNGSYETVGALGVANAGVRNAVPNAVILTPANTVTAYSQYNQTSYAQFAEQQAATFGAALPSLPIDAKLLVLDFGSILGTAPALTMTGTLNQAPAQADGLTGAAGTLIVTTGSTYAGNNTPIDILGSGQPPISGALSLSANALDAFKPGALVIGGIYLEANEPGQAIAVNNTTPSNVAIYEGTGGDVTVESGAVLTAPQIFLISEGTVTVDSGATLSTIGQGAAPWDSGTNGVVAEVHGVALSNGAITLVPALANGPLQATASTTAINIQNGATLLAGGTLGLEATNGLTFGSNVTLGARDLVIAVPSVNIGNNSALAGAQSAGVLPAGWSLDQATLNSLIAGNGGAGVPALQSLTLTASNSVNFFGTVNVSTLDSTTGKPDLSLVLNTPAIYGYGSSSDVATLTVGTLYWNGVGVVGAQNSQTGVYAVTSAAPPVPVSNGPGTGSGTLDLIAQQIVFGYGPNTMPQDQTALNRQTLGFGVVNLEAGQSISANNNGTLSVYQTQTSGGPTPTYSGGALNLVTPLLTGQAGSVMGYTAGGALSIAAPVGVSPVATSTISSLGAEVDLNANVVAIDTAVALPTGKLSVNATGSIQLGAHADLDLAGRTTLMFDQTEYSWGGDLILLSAQGNIAQATGSVIDVSAVNNSAGTITAQAVASSAGQVVLNGTLLGASTSTPGATGAGLGGSISVDAQTLASGSGSNFTTDLAALNAMLDAGGFYGARSFDLKAPGDLAINGTLKAQTVNISVDNGSLTVNGTIDASGATPGNINLAAMQSLTLAGASVLDAHGAVLQIDSYGNPIDAENRATVTLTATTGTLSLAAGATIDVSSPDPTPQGQVVLNASRLGAGASATASASINDPVEGSLTTGSNAPVNATGSDIAISASGPITIRGAQSVALNAFATYKNAPADQNDPNGQVIDQGYLNLIDQDSQAFISNIYGGNAAAGVLTGNLQGKLAGLLAPQYLSIFHIRPGVEIDSASPSGNLSTSGDIDLAGYRYGPNADRSPSDPNYGAGEPLALVARAGGNLTINGNITDGFEPAPVINIPGTFNVVAAPNTNVASAVAAADPSLFKLNNVTKSGITAHFYSTFPTSVYGSNLSFYLVTNWVIPGDGLYATLLKKITTISNGVYNIVSGQTTTIPAGTLIAASSLDFEVGVPFPGIELALTPPTIIPTHQTEAAATMLPAGSLSASIRLVAGADLAAADTRTLLPQSVLGGNGNLTLNAPQLFDQTENPTPSVIRTGTGDLDIYAGGNFSQNSLYGIYTAGTQSAGITSGYNSPLADTGGLPPVSYQAYYPTGGGDLTLDAQGNVTSLVSRPSNFQSSSSVDSPIADWLWEQGGAGEQAAWWINFGTYVLPRDVNGLISSSTPAFVGFYGIGTLGGGNLTVTAGGNAGVINSSSISRGATTIESTALNLTVASTGRILSNGALVETGGGALTLDIGGKLNPGEPTGAQLYNQDWGVITNLRGTSLIKAGSIGSVNLQYELANADNPLPADPLSPIAATIVGGPVLAPGDSDMVLETRGDLALGSAVDPGRQFAQNATVALVGGQTGDNLAWFTLWTAKSGISLMSAGGNLAPEDLFNAAPYGVDAPTDYDGAYIYPPSLQAVAMSGSIYYAGISNTSGGQIPPTIIELAPSPIGQMQLLAGNSIYESGLAVDWAMSGAALSTEATPFNPGFLLLPTGASEATDPSRTGLATSYFYPQTPLQITRSLYSFAPDTVTTDLHVGDAQPAQFYAVTGNIVGLNIGAVSLTEFIQGQGEIFETNYLGAKATDVRAGVNIVNLGEPYTLPLASTANKSGVPGYGSFILNANPTDVSVIQAGGSIYYANLAVGGPGTLEVIAGGNIYQGDHGLIESIGPVYNVNPYDHSSGANVIVMPGVGPAGPDWSAFASLYFNPANQGDPEQNPADVAQTYQAQLYQWLQQTYGYMGTQAGALAYFQSLPVPQQSVFELQVYFDELNASGLEFNQASSLRYKSYIRGKEAIATLFPATGSNGQPISYSGSLTMESGQEAFSYGGGAFDSGIHTEFGGSVQIVDPGGAVTVGANAIQPGSGTGILTEGSGDVDIYSLGSVELGLSRIFTTFGGDIVIWSAAGDIAAGRGAKGTTVFAPARRVYTDYGVVALSPTVPTTGAGIATLAPIPDIPPGDINLIAPLGVVDAGEAGIRVSGNLNIAALQVINAANIQVQGTATGIPQAVAVNVGALNAANSASAAVTQIASQVAQQAPPPPPQAPAIVTVHFVGFGDQ